VRNARTIWSLVFFEKSKGTRVSREVVTSSSRLPRALVKPGGGARVGIVGGLVFFFTRVMKNGEDGRDSFHFMRSKKTGNKYVW